MKLKLALTIVILFCFSGNLYAHTLQSDQNFGAVIHLDPNDLPEVKKPTNVYIEFSSQFYDFVNDCKCRVTISSTQTQDVVAIPVKISDSAIGFQVTFPIEGEYKLELLGTYLNEEVKLIYSINVVPQNYFNNFAFAAMGLGVFMLVGVGGYFVYKRRFK